MAHVTTPLTPTLSPTSPEASSGPRSLGGGGPQAGRRRQIERLVALVKAAARLVLGLLRELSDESAYARYLAARGERPSPAAWRAFSDERLGAKYKRAKCC